MRNKGRGRGAGGRGKRGGGGNEKKDLAKLEKGSKEEEVEGD